MDRAGRQIFWESVKTLRRLAEESDSFRPPHPVKVQIVRKCGSDCACDSLAETRLHRRRRVARGQDRFYFRINILEKLSGIHAVDVLVHEWSHLLDWEPGHVEDDSHRFKTLEDEMHHHHRDSWGIVFARLYRQFHWPKPKKGSR